MTFATVRSALAQRARFPLATTPTPLHELPRLRETLGGSARCPRIFAKRDDLTGLALGGNKARKLEFLVADALANRADTLITTGATQSNHARMTAAAASLAGMECHLVLTAEDRPKGAPPPLEGNLLLDHLYGAHLHHVSDDDHENADDKKIAELERDLGRAGKTPYVIPVGGSNAIGVLGYTLGSVELADQLASAALRPARLYYASGSRGTQAGLVLGAKLCGATYQPYGIAVSANSPAKTERALQIAHQAAALLQLSISIGSDDLVTDPNFIGAGYGIATADGLEAIDLLARTEALLLDPSYTGKAMAALIAHARAGNLNPEEPVVFLHTGGIPALFTAAFARSVEARNANHKFDHG